MKKYRYGVKYFEIKGMNGAYDLQHPGRTSVVFAVSGNLIGGVLLVDDKWCMLQGYKSGQPPAMVYVAKWTIKNRIL